jgi:hypothetical protein
VLDKLYETNNLQLSEVTEENIRMLIFNDEFSIEIWSWNTPEMTLTINDVIYNVVLRP